MGIKGLTALISEHAPKAITEHDIKTLFGRKVAIDASMSIYQFLIAVRQKDGEMLTNDAGETTSHLMGFFYRTIRIVENGIKPAYVFDGKPPELKSGVLSKRFERREEAKEEGEEAKETGTAEDVDRLSRRTVKVTKEHNEECRKLLKLMGIPVIVVCLLMCSVTQSSIPSQAPSEAEAQCAELARGGKVYAAGSEDMDTLTFNAPILYRHLTFSEAKKAPISEINLQKALEGLEMDMPQFIDLCILLGCDYLEPIRGVGPKSALKLIREYGGLAGVVEHLREKQADKEEKAADAEDGAKKKKGGVQVPEEWPWEEAKKLFEKPDVVPASEVELEWKDPDIDGLVQFLVTEKGFNEDRVRKGAEKLQKFLNAKQQGRLDGFFSVQPKTSPKKSKVDDTKSKSKTVKDGKGTKRKASICSRPDDLSLTSYQAEEKAGASSSKKSKTKK
ncbi:PIN domain-like protein [Suillus decipiens]|nr:PIN domain-like protein [Suillus decipiens]